MAEEKKIEEDPMKLEPFKLRVLKLMAELVAPKDSRNSFGKYNYRSTESITEALKPLCLKYRILPSMTEVDSDDSAQAPWVKAIVTLEDVYSDEKKTTEARVFIDMSRKGMSLEQMSGAALSYSRKYAWGGLLLIDDTKDPDTDEYQRASQRSADTKANNTTPKASKAATGGAITEQEAKIIARMLSEEQRAWALKTYRISSLNEMTKAEYTQLMNTLKKREEQKNEAQSKAE